MPIFNRNGDFIASRWSVNTPQTVVQLRGESTFRDVFPLTSGGGVWLDENRVVAQVCGHGGQKGCQLWEWDKRTNATRVVSEVGASVLFGDGGVWAAGLDHYGMYISNGDRFKESSPAAVGPDGSITLKVLTNSFGPFDVIEKSGARWRLTDGDALGVQLFGNRRAQWEEAGAIRTYGGVPVPRIVGSPFYGMKMIEINGQWWALYQSSVVKFHPVDSSFGYVVTDQPDAFMRDLVLLPDGKVLIGWNPSAGDPIERVVLRAIDLNAPRVDLTQVKPVEPPEPVDPEEPTVTVRPVITVREYGRTIAAGKNVSIVKALIGDTEVEVRKDASDNLWVTASNSAGAEATGAVRHIAVVGPAGTVPAPTPEPPGPTIPPSPGPLPSPEPPKPPTGSGAVLGWNGRAWGLSPDLRLVQVEPSKAVDVEFIPMVGGVALKVKGKWVSSDGEVLVANRDEVGEWEVFKKARKDKGWTLQDVHGKFVNQSVDNKAITSDRDSADYQEVFTGGGAPVRAVSPVFLGPGVPWLHLDDNSIWVWRYVSGLELASRSGEDQDKYLDWADSKKFTGTRVLATHAHNPPLPPAAGQAALPPLFEKLRARGMGGEIVCLADTKTQGLTRDQMRHHCHAVGALVAASGLPLTIEIANENGHDTQQSDLTDPGFLKELRSLIPSNIPVAMGCWGDDTRESYPDGDYITEHRDRGRDTINEAVRVKHLIELMEAANNLVVDDEPIGAFESEIGGKRSNNPSRYFIHGVLGKLGGIGSTFHYDQGVPAFLPGPLADQCADAFIEGATLVPDDAVFAFVNDHGGGAITEQNDWSQVFKLFSFIGGPKSYLVALGVKDRDALRINYTNGWRPVGIVAEKFNPGVQVIEVTR